MRLVLPALLCALALSGCQSVTGISPAAKSVPSPSLAFTNGRWFNGQNFEAKTLYCEQGVFTTERPQDLSDTVDLTGHYIIPPFADAHTHHFDNEGIFEAVNTMSLKQGVFYAASMTNWADGKQALSERVASPTTVDIIYADAGITASLGHPIPIYESLARNDFSFDKSKVTYAESPLALDKAYRIVDSPSDIEPVWQATLSTQPDLVKLYLMMSEQYEERKDNTDRYGDRGLNPDYIPLLVKKAHASNVRVAAHVESAEDFAVAVSAGVDIIAHLPGYGPVEGESMSAYQIPLEVARLAAKQGTIVIPTPIANTEGRYKDISYANKVRQTQRENIQSLKEAGVKFAIGADAYFGTPLVEVKKLKDFDLFTHAELIDMWTKDSAQAIFPERKLGVLKAGYEASFIALNADPLNDLTAIEQIETRVKSCHLLGGL